MRSLTPQEIAVLSATGVTSKELSVGWNLIPNQDFVTALSYEILVKKGQIPRKKEEIIIN